MYTHWVPFILLGICGGLFLSALYLLFLVFFGKYHKQPLCVAMSNLGDEMQVRSVRAVGFDEVEAINQTPTWWAKINPKHEARVAIDPGNNAMALKTKE